MRLLALCLALCGGLPASTQAGTPSQTHTVTIENMQFSPQSLTARRGDRVVWVNKDLFRHTATADAKAFDSKSIAAGATWTYVANKAGEYAYTCTLHPTMKGKLLIK